MHGARYRLALRHSLELQHGGDNETPRIPHKPTSTRAAPLFIHKPRLSFMELEQWIDVQPCSEPIPAL
jgi:hypothetical protein